jgi:CRISPR system Cascade subunit CasA
MAKSLDAVPIFNLWTEPWITLECADGQTERLGIEQTLLCSHEFKGIYDPSPLVVVGIHRLLVAVLQAALQPQKSADLKRVWSEGRFPIKKLKEFSDRYAQRFDLFSVDAPFLQSADLPIHAEKGAKPVAYLYPDIPAGIGITHYRHGAEDSHILCPSCAARGLVVIPAFATSGGAGIKPSINGVPPIYVIPGGQNLFASLAASLVLPTYQPEVADANRDTAWWERSPHVKRGEEVRSVGYLASLTFPARRVRLHPEHLGENCTRCGNPSEWNVRTMVFEMGESRPKNAAFWFDPFAAYRLPDGKSKTAPTPVRPTEGQVLWREFAGLFLQAETPKHKPRTRRPRVLDQIAELKIAADYAAYPFRCIGLRTDMKAKVFEWIDAGFDVPPALLSDAEAAVRVEQAIEFATECGRIIARVFARRLGAKIKNREHHHALRTRMSDDFWTALTGPFRDFYFTLSGTPIDRRNALALKWANLVVASALEAFTRAASSIGEDAASLRDCVRGENECRRRLYGYRNQQYPPEKE